MVSAPEFEIGKLAPYLVAIIGFPIVGFVEAFIWFANFGHEGEAFWVFSLGVLTGFVLGAIVEIPTLAAFVESGRYSKQAVLINVGWGLFAGMLWLYFGSYNQATMAIFKGSIACGVAGVVWVWIRRRLT